MYSGMYNPVVNYILSMRRRPPRLLLAMPIFSQPLDGGTLICRSCGLRLEYLDLWIDLLTKQALSVVSSLPRFTQRHMWVGAEHQPLFLAGKAVLHPPRFEAAFRDEEVEPPGVGKFVIFTASLRFSCLQFGQA